MSVTACRDHSPAEWIASSDRPWHRLVSPGPGGYAAYARLRSTPDPTGPGQAEADVDSEDTAALETARLRTAAAALAARTRTPRRCRSAVWDGWGCLPTARGVERRPALHRPPRELEPPGPGARLARRPGVVPHPGRRPDCAAIAASTAAVEDLLRTPDLDVVRADPDQDPPHHL
ncbi:hypothetical protein [Kineococcus indalonis]|uniref:hypothetical protein n=1 Tax=Kineococcus indalonis TaxID=2696566 RepID=UPI001411CE1E|nr:hypothetical protein [Kineococcus indalonis]NAZ85429.1 hypothetical protein [Kineococcus indalonis]